MPDVKTCVFCGRELRNRRRRWNSTVMCPSARQCADHLRKRASEVTS